MRVLIVEDEPFMVEAIRDGLRLEAITADVAADGDTALRIPLAIMLQMITNLVHNAIVHNHPAEGTVWATTADYAGTATVTVQNTGEQLGPELVSTLSEPFQRGNERARPSGHAGVGLGLAIVKTIVEAYDETLTVTPRPAGGLHVTVTLPRPAPFNVRAGPAHPEP